MYILFICIVFKLYICDIIEYNIVSSPLWSALDPGKCFSMEVVGMEHYQVDNGIIHRKAMKAICLPSGKRILTTKHGVQCMSRALEEGVGQGQRVE